MKYLLLLIMSNIFVLGQTVDEKLTEMLFELRDNEYKEVLLRYKNKIDDKHLYYDLQEAEQYNSIREVTIDIITKYFRIDFVFSKILLIESKGRLNTSTPIWSTLLYGTLIDYENRQINYFPIDDNYVFNYRINETKSIFSDLVVELAKNNIDSLIQLANEINKWDGPKKSFQVTEISRDSIRTYHIKGFWGMYRWEEEDFKYNKATFEKVFNDNILSDFELPIGYKIIYRKKVE